MREWKIKKEIVDNTWTGQHFDHILSKESQPKGTRDVLNLATDDHLKCIETKSVRIRSKDPAEEEIISLSSDCDGEGSPRSDELPIIELQKVSSDPLDSVSSYPPIAEIATTASVAEAKLFSPGPDRPGSANLRKNNVNETNDLIAQRSRLQEIVISDSDDNYPNRTVLLSEDEDNDRPMESNADNDCKSDSENSYVAILREEKEDYKKEDDDIEELLGNSPTEADVVTLSDTEHVNVSVNMSKLFGFNIFFILEFRRTPASSVRPGDASCEKETRGQGEVAVSRTELEVEIKVWRCSSFCDRGAEDWWR